MSCCTPVEGLFSTPDDILCCAHQDCSISASTQLMHGLCACSPFAYALRAVVVNEMTSSQWAERASNGRQTVGQASLESFGFFTNRQVCPQ